jgi:hypothetical protein
VSQGDLELLRELFAISDVNEGAERWQPDIEWVIAREHDPREALEVVGVVE